MLTLQHLALLRQTAAPRLRTVLALLVLCVLSLWACVKFLGWWTHEEASHRTLAVQALGPETQALIVGSSHVFASINPSLMRLPSMNLAAPVCSYVCAEAILHGNLARAPAVRAVVIELDVVPAFYDTLRAYQGDYRHLLELRPDVGAMQVGLREKYTLWRDSTLERSFFGPLFQFDKLTPRGLYGHLHGHVGEDAVVAAGYANGHESLPPGDDGPARVRRHVREAVGISELPRNEAALRRILHFGASRNLKLAVVRLPHHPGYWTALPQEWTLAMAALLDRLQHEFGHSLEYWDFGHLPELTDADFRNGDHLNHAAATRFTTRIDERLRQWLSESPTEDP